MSQGVTSGIALTVAAYLMFALQDASVKWLVDDYPVVQILFVRSAVILVLCLACGPRGLAVKAVRSPIVKVMFVRTALLLGAWTAYFSAARDLSLPELTTLYYLSPVLITTLAIPFLKERVTTIRWLSVLLGLAGELVAVNPLTQGWRPDTATALALLAAFLWAVSTLLLRKSAMGERTIVQMTVFSALLVAVTGAVSIGYWKPVSIGAAVLMILTGAFAAVGQLALFESFRRAPVSVLAPFEYSALVWAFILGAAIWGDVPHANVFVGAGLIVIAGVVVVLFERKSA